MLLGVVLAFNVKLDKANEVKAFHKGLESIHWRTGHALPDTSNTYFAASGKCTDCHGTDTSGIANFDDNHHDINNVEYWRATMMANSAKDPFWRAKVRHEILVNPAHQAVLENKCTSCHAPMGHFNALLSGQGHYTLAQMVNDPLALDGVSCNACHQIKADSIGLLFSGNQKYETDPFLYGPYPNPLGSSMLQSGFEPLYSQHINDAGLCAGCHTLITNTTDLNGNETGDKFVEQGTYQEWVNSIYNDSITCQVCHIPRIPDSVIISSYPAFLNFHAPYGLHELVGGNTFMLKLLKANIDNLGITAEEANFDSVLARTNRMLQQKTLDVQLTESVRSSDTAFFDFRIHNKAGHKFPSGYPSRRVFVQFIALKENSDTLFSSGIWNQQYQLIGHDSIYEVHYNMINRESQVQIYELVMGDVNGHKTTVLGRAKNPLKDNRIPPLGFTTTHYTYDTVAIAGNALQDSDFNISNAQEGTGTDIIHFHIPLNGYNGTINISAKVYYQPVPLRWNEEMFAYSSTEIDTFKTMYQQTNGTPVLVAEDEVQSAPAGFAHENLPGIVVFPNPVEDMLFLKIKQLSPALFTIYGANGKLILSRRIQGNTSLDLHSIEQGIYFYQIEIAGRLVKAGKLVKRDSGFAK